MSDSQSFIDRLLAGETDLDVDDFIDTWHEGDESDDTPLHDYLGMTWDEYGRWIKDPDTLDEILEARREQRE